MLPYVSRDVATEPPTTVVIVPTGGPPVVPPTGEDPFFAISEDCIEPTMGWQNREGKPLLTICFMHSFGKCIGRTNSDPSTCYQIHVKPDIVNALRRHYANPTRRYFTRTVKAQLSPEMRHQLSVKAQKELRVQYLEYRVQDTYPSAGLQHYEAAYRRWLFDGDARTEAGANISIVQCTAFANTGSCPSGVECPFIHAHPKSAHVRDPVLGRALLELGDAAARARGPATNNENGQLRDQNAGVLANSVPIYTLLQSQDGHCGPRLIPLHYAPGQERTAVPINYAGIPPAPPQTNHAILHGNHAGKESVSRLYDQEMWFSSHSTDGLSTNRHHASSGSCSD